MLKKSFFIILASVIVISIFFFNTYESFASKTIKIGVLAPFHAVAGEGIIQAAKMASKEINSSGGVNGKNIELFIRDTEINPEKAIAALKKTRL